MTNRNRHVERALSIGSRPTATKEERILVEAIQRLSSRVLALEADNKRLRKLCGESEESEFTT